MIFKHFSLRLFIQLGALQILGACGSNSYLIGAGAFTPAISKLSTSASGASATLAPLTFPVALRAKQKNPRISFFESVEINPFPGRSPENGIWQFHSQVRLGLTPHFSAYGPFEWSFFSSAHSNILYGRGLAVELNNGTSTTTFYTPGATRIAQTLNLGSEIAFVLTDEWMIAQGLIAESPFSKTRRQWSGFFTLWYKWKGTAL